MTSRLAIAKAVGMDERTLRHMERDGRLPRFGTCDPGIYLAKVKMIAAARKDGIKPREQRRGLGGGGEEGGMNYAERERRLGGQHGHTLITGRSFAGGYAQRPAHLEETRLVKEEEAKGMTHDAAIAKVKRENPDLAHASRVILTGKMKDIAYGELHAAIASGNFDMPSKFGPFTAASPTVKGPVRGAPVHWRHGVRVIRLTNMMELQGDERLRALVFIKQGTTAATLGVQLIDWGGFPLTPGQINWDGILQAAVARQIVHPTAVRE